MALLFPPSKAFDLDTRAGFKKDCSLVAILYAEEGHASIRGSPRCKTAPNGTVIALPASNEKAVRYTFGTAIDSDIYIEGDDWVLIRHFELWQDPQHQHVWIKNSHPSRNFSARKVASYDSTLFIKPGKQEVLSPGAWHLTVGQGLVLRIIAAPQTLDGSLGADNGAIHQVKRTRKQKTPPIKRQTEEDSKESSRDETRHSAGKDQNAKVLATRTTILSGRDSKTGLYKSQTVRTGVKQLKRRESKRLLRHPETGGSAEVVFSRCQNRLVAIKTYRTSDPEEANRAWQSEANILGILGNHPQIVELIAKCENPYSLILEDAGRDLNFFADENKKSTLNSEEAANIFLDISRALEYMHEKCIAHLDVKPSNILFNQATFRAKLCDFGISMPFNDLSIHSSGGTPCYIPPEYMWYGNRTSLSDLWALGVTMLYVFRQIPIPQHSWIIKDRTKPEVMAKMLEWMEIVQTARRKLPKELGVVRKLLEDNPENRITGSELVNELLEQSQSGAVLMA